jgi:hypothetical protein
MVSRIIIDNLKPTAMKILALLFVMLLYFGFALQHTFENITYSASTVQDLKNAERISPEGYLLDEFVFVAEAPVFVE